MKQVTTENKAQCHDVVCQRHFTDLIWIRPTDRLNHSESSFDLHQHE